MKKTCKYCNHQRRREHGFETVDTLGRQVFICWFCYSKQTHNYSTKQNLKDDWKGKNQSSTELKFFIMIVSILAVGGFFAWLMSQGK